MLARAYGSVWVLYLAVAAVFDLPIVLDRAFAITMVVIGLLLLIARVIGSRRKRKTGAVTPADLDRSGTVLSSGYGAVAESAFPDGT